VKTFVDSHGPVIGTLGPTRGAGFDVATAEFRRPHDRIFVGRTDELSRVQTLVDGDGARLLFVHGVSGTGKSALLDHVASRANEPRLRLVVLDCQDIEPTEEGFRAALSAGLGRDVEVGSGDGFGWLGDRADCVVVCLDQYEVLRLLDTWLRQNFVPAVPTNVRILIASREEPHSAWHRLPAGTFETMRLGPLPHADSRALLSEFGVEEGAARSIAAFAGGHPLTLLLAALASREQQPSRTVRDVTLDRLLDEFTRVYLDDLDPATHDLLQAASVVRRVTRPLLVAMLPDVDAWKAFEALAAVPFVERTSEGLAIHDAVRQAILNDLRGADPARHRELRRRAWTHLRTELRQAPGSALWRHTADMVYLIENPFVREAHFPSDAHAYAIEDATAADEDAIHALIAHFEPPTSADLLRSWWRRRPDTFRVARDTSGAVAGFFILAPSDRLDLRIFADDPVVAGWLDHLARDPIPANQLLLLGRRWLTWDAGEGLSPPQASFWLDLKRYYMALRPRLRRNYGTTVHPEIYGQVLGSLGGGTIPNGAVELDGITYHGLYLEFGPSSVDGWLTRLAAEEVGLADDDLLDVDMRQLLLDDQRIDLTPLEFEVLHYLRERTGAPISRHALLSDIWGHDTVVGSNVVDVVISGLRNKLGRHADMVETVRGVGYRFRTHPTRDS
jgi:hypothetical protein